MSREAEKSARAVSIWEKASKQACLLHGIDWQKGTHAPFRGTRAMNLAALARCARDFSKDLDFFTLKPQKQSPTGGCPGGPIDDTDER